MNNDTMKLRSELISMLDALHLKVEQLEKRIAGLESGTNPDNAISPVITQVTLTPAEIPDRSQNFTTKQTSEKITDTPLSENQLEKDTVTSSVAVAKTSKEDQETLANKIVDTNKNKETEQTAQPWGAKVIVPEKTSQNSSKPKINPFAAVGELLAMIFGPFSGVFYQVMKVYKRYQEQGRGPAFLMTAAGILALVMGFGFLLQYSFTNYLGIGGKIATGFISAIALVILGIRISNKGTMLSEFGAAIIGLGIILNYLCAYFISGHFNIVGPTVGLVLLAAITFASYWLAVHYDTKTVAILSLLGGASTPLFLGDLTQVSTIYFVYLSFLVATMLHLAHKIKWPNLIQFTLIISIAMTQYLFFEQGGNHFINNTLFVVLLHVLFYSFSFACFHHISKSETTIDRSILLSVIANIIFFVFVLYQSISIDHYLGLTYLLNAVVLLLFYRFNWLTSYSTQNSKNDFNVLLILQTGLLVGFGILYLVNPALLGLIWGVEGLALVYVGFRFAMPSIRVEGHIAFIIGMSSAAYESIIWFTNGLSTQHNTVNQVTLNYDTGWMNLIVFGAVLWIAARLLQYNINKCLKWEKTVCFWSHEIFSIWLSLAFMISFLVVMTDELLLLSIVPLFILLYRAQKYKLPISEVLGLAHYFLFIAQIFISANQVHSFSTSDQNWIGIAVRVEAFVTLWLIAEFYSRFYPKSKFSGFARTLRIIFYVLIPLLFIPKIIKSYDEFFPIALWVSALISLFLFTRVKYKALKIEFYLLTGFAWFFVVVANLADYTNIWEVKAGYALLSGLVFFILTSFIWKAFSVKSLEPALTDQQSDKNSDLISSYYYTIIDYIKLHHWSVYYLATCIFIITFGTSHSILLSILITSIYFTLLCLSWPKVIPAKPTIKLSYIFLQILSLITLLLLYAGFSNHYLMSSFYLVMQLALTGFLLHKRMSASDKLWSFFGGYNSQLHLWNIFFFPLSLLIITYNFTLNIQLAITICSIYYASLCIIWPKFSPANISLRFSYNLLVFFSFITFIMTLYPFTEKTSLSPVYLIIQACLLGYLLHNKTKSSELTWKYFAGYLTQLWIFNLFVIVVYTTAIYYWIPDQLRILLSLMLVLHATIVLMLTLKENFSGLLKLSVILFVTAAIKILMFDMADFSLVQKIIAFMIIGAMLLGASYLYQRVQQKIDIVKLNSDSTSS
jgi:hypothetical protein